MLPFWRERLIAIFIPLFVIIAVVFILFYAFHVSFAIKPPENVAFVQEIREKNATKKVEEVVAMDKAHRSDRELQKLITQGVSEALSFNKDNFSPVMKKMRIYFTQEGFEQYKNYLLSSGIAETIRTNDASVSAYIESSPIYLNSSVIDGAYKWLYETPVVLSIFPKNMKMTPENVQSQITRKLKLRIQITRAEVGEFTEALQFESWIVAPR